MKNFREVGARMNSDLERRSWQRAIAAKVLASKYTNDASKIAADTVKSAWPNDDRALMITRGAVTPTTSADWWSYNPVVAYRSLCPNSAALALFQMGMALDLTGATTIRIPSVPTAVGQPVPAVFVEEGKPAPSVQWNFDADIILGPARKLLMLSAVTEELENCTPDTASAVIGRVLVDVANRGIDATAFSSADPDVATPAGLLFGVEAIDAASAGPDAMVTDLGNLTGAIGAAGIDASDAVFVAGPAEVTKMKAKLGPRFDFPILMTLGLPAKSVACFAPAGVASGYQGPPVITTNKNAAWHFEGSTPTDISSGAGIAAPVKSALQAALIAISVRANFAWAVAKGAAQAITAVNW